MTKAADLPHRIAIIGAGWAGCAAAVTLAKAGRQVSLFEAARTLGGRARRIDSDGRQLDNGQHILLGAYRTTLKLMKTVGIDLQQSMLRLPLQMRYPAACDGMDFVAPKLPAPWHVAVALLRARGLSRQDKLALARFSSAARWMGWQLHDDCSVSTLLERFDQTERLNRLMWTPLCIAALNTPPQRASAQVFLSVLRDSLGARRSASDMLIPRTDLSALFPTQAATFVTDHGGDVSTGQGHRPAGNCISSKIRWLRSSMASSSPRVPKLPPTCSTASATRSCCAVSTTSRSLPVICNMPPRCDCHSRSTPCSIRLNKAIGANSSSIAANSAAAKTTPACWRS